MQPTEKDQERARKGMDKSQITQCQKSQVKEMFQEGRQVRNSLVVRWLGVTGFISANHLARWIQRNNW